MFFRHQRAKKLSFEDRLDAARKAGFSVQSVGNGQYRVERSGVASVLQPGKDDTLTASVKPGIIMEGEIAALADGGFQKVFLTPIGQRKPALASDLRAIHEFQEDLREALGLTSLYNESMGTVSNLYVYDRVEGRDFGRANKPWQATLRKH